MVCITYTFNKSVATIDVEGYNKTNYLVSYQPLQVGFCNAFSGDRHSAGAGLIELFDNL